MNQTYKQQFADPVMATSYEQTEYAPGSYSDLLWQIEKRQLAELIAAVRKTHSHIDYLDFAAGTGRIISFVEPMVDNATGIEISQQMVDLASKKLTKGTMLCKDITGPDAEIESRYDLITTFRFILNAEPTLRLAGIKALAARLKDPSSVLILNNHGNLFSHKLLMWPIHAVRRMGKGYLAEGNYMTHGQVMKLLDACGLEVVGSVGCGFLGGRIASLVGHKRARAWENAAASSGSLKRLCVNRMYVTRLKSRP